MFSQRAKQSLELIIQSGHRYVCSLQADTCDVQYLAHKAKIWASKEQDCVPDEALPLRRIYNIQFDYYRRSQTVQYSTADDTGCHEEGLVVLLALGAERRTSFLFALPERTADQLGRVAGRSLVIVLRLIRRARISHKILRLEGSVNPWGRDDSRNSV